MQLVTTGEKWIGYGVQTINSKIVELLKSAKDSIFLSIFIITDNAILEIIKEKLDAGIEIEIYCFENSDFNNKYIVDTLQQYSFQYDYFNYYKITEDVLHAKVLIIDDTKIVIGSANLTYGGFVKNYEMGIYLEDNAMSNQITKLLRRLQK
jgi:phosphatidylserine/phosphatidylglycerophosphate/cardiolipin synthase-like enzyme